MSKQIAAHTNPGGIFPGYVNFTREEDGRVTVHLRSDPAVLENRAYICGFGADRGKPGRCTPGDDRCNNYCNMAPQKGPMQPAPLRCTQVVEGVVATLTLSAEVFAALIAEAAAK